jgi:release factor glutamine methyltransferase
MSRTWTVLELLRWTTMHFAERGIDTPRLDAECLLAAVLGSDRLRLYLDFDKPVEPDERVRFRELVRKRASQRVPIAQLTGRKEFWSLSLEITPDVLTPRPETETLVEVALRLLPERDTGAHVLDVGTGSGAVALALARERPHARVVASEPSPAALAVARRNAAALGLGGRVRFVEGALFEAFEAERFDLVVSNPPYLAEQEEDGLPPELAHEPRCALFGGSDGYAVLRPLVSDAAAHLAPGGTFAVELAPAQAETVARWCEGAGFEDVCIHVDLARRPRVVSGRRAASVRCVARESAVVAEATRGA